jgi:hypothetical protein
MTGLCRGRGDGRRYNTNDDIQTGIDYATTGQLPGRMLWHVITRNDNNYKWTDWLLNGRNDVSLLWVDGRPKVYFIEKELSPSLFYEISPILLGKSKSVILCSACQSSTPQSVKKIYSKFKVSCNENLLCRKSLKCIVPHHGIRYSPNDGRESFQCHSTKTHGIQSQSNV